MYAGNSSGASDNPLINAAAVQLIKVLAENGLSSCRLTVPASTSLEHTESYTVTVEAHDIIEDIRPEPSGLLGAFIVCAEQKD